jgi:hypothetical protein
MTDNPAVSIPAGWYPDSSTPGVVRWWDGVAWTEHTAAAAGSSGRDRPLLPADRPVYSRFIWVIALLPLVPYLSFFAWSPDFSSFGVNPNGAGQFSPLAIYTPGYFLIVGVAWAVYGLTAFFAYRDWVWLKRHGVVRPFHWALSFLGGFVYVIGRSVIVRSVAAPRGLAPIWAWIGVFVIGIVITVAWAVMFTAGVMDQLRPGVGA